ncbi:MAG: PCRF domain-containing protein, partial [Chitinophagaceae bacterium]
MTNSEQVKDIEQRVTALRKYLDIDRKLIEISNEEEKTLAPDFWNNAREAEAFVKVLRSKKAWVDDYLKSISLSDELQLAYEFYREGELSEEELDAAYATVNSLVENIEFRNMLSDEGDSLSAVLQITAGAGGTESCDWASMLMRMYLMWAENHGYKIKELNFQEGDVAGIKTVTLEIEGDFAFGWLKGE